MPSNDSGPCCNSAAGRAVRAIEQVVREVDTAVPVVRLRNVDSVLALLLAAIGT